MKSAREIEQFLVDWFEKNASQPVKIHGAAFIVTVEPAVRTETQKGRGVPYPVLYPVVPDEHCSRLDAEVVAIEELANALYREFVPVRG